MSEPVDPLGNETRGRRRPEPRRPANFTGSAGRRGKAHHVSQCHSRARAIGSLNHVVPRLAVSHRAADGVQSRPAWLDRRRACPLHSRARAPEDSRKPSQRNSGKTKAASGHASLGTCPKTPTSATGSRTGTRTRVPTSGPRPPIRFWNRSPRTAIELATQDTSS